MIEGKDWDRVENVLGVQVAIKKPERIVYGRVLHGLLYQAKMGVSTA